MTENFLIGNFSDLTCGKGWILTSEGKLYSNGKYVKDAACKHYLFFSDDDQLVLEVKQEKITLKRHDNPVVVGLKILIYTHGKWTAYNYNEQFSRTYLVKTAESSFFVPQLADVIIIAVSQAVSDINIDPITKELSFTNLDQQTGTLVLYYYDRATPQQAYKATVLAFLETAVTPPQPQPRPTIFNGIATNSFVGPVLPIETIARRMQRDFGEAVLFAVDQGVTELTLRREATENIYLVDSNLPLSSSGDTTATTTVVGATKVIEPLPSNYPVRIITINDPALPISDHRLVLELKATVAAEAGYFRSPLLGAKYTFPAFEPFNLIEDSSRSVVASAVTPDTRNPLNPNALLSFSAIEANVVNTGLPPSVANVTVTNNFISLPSASQFGPIAGYYPLLAVLDLALAAESYEAGTRPQFAAIPNGEVVFVVYEDQVDSYPACEICRETNLLYGSYQGIGGRLYYDFE